MIKVRIAYCHIASPKESLIFKMLRVILSILLKRNTTNWFACGINAAKWLYGEKAYNNGKVYIMNNAIDTEKYSYIWS